MTEFENIGRKLPYDLPPHSLDALQQRIRLRTTARPARPPRNSALRLALPVAAAALLLFAGIVTFERLQPACPESAPDLEELLATAPPEVISRAAAENYDDILYNQQL